MSADFGTNEHLNLPVISELIANELRARVSELHKSFEVKDIQPLQIVTGKGYSAKGQAQIASSRGRVGSGTLYTLLFRPGDGTGSNTDFQLSGVPPKYTPRVKTDYAEVFLALGTAYQNEWFPRITSLVEVSNRGNRLVELERPLIVKPQALERTLKTKSPDQTLPSPVQFTLRMDRNYGNPHAIIFPDGSALDQFRPYETFFQVGAFLAFPQKTRELVIVQGNC